MRYRKSFQKWKRPLSGPLHTVSPTGSLDRHDVRGLCALRALHDLERHFLTFGQRLVTLHADRREVHEDVVSAFALDEAEALLVREPFHGALCHLFLLTTQTPTTRAPSRRPM